MDTLKFKTDIKCTGCIEKVGPPLDARIGKNNWQVDVQSADRILTVQTDSSGGEVIDTIKESGYEATKVD